MTALDTGRRSTRRTVCCTNETAITYRGLSLNLLAGLPAATPRRRLLAPHRRVDLLAVILDLRRLSQVRHEHLNALLAELVQPKPRCAALLVPRRAVADHALVDPQHVRGLAGLTGWLTADRRERRADRLQY